MYNFISIKESRWPQASSKLYIVYKAMIRNNGKQQSTINQYVIANAILNIICCDRKSPINNSRTVICSLHETKVIVQQITSVDVIFNDTKLLHDINQNTVLFQQSLDPFFGHQQVIMHPDLYFVYFAIDILNIK